MEEPNFEAYSYSQLLDVYSHIDEKEYPERKLKVGRLIRSKSSSESEADQKEDREKDKYSTFFPRLIAGFIDGIAVSIALWFLGLFFSSTADSGYRSLVDLVFFTAYSISFHAISGQTLGKAVMKVKVVDFVTGGELTVWQAIARDSIPTLLVIILVALNLAFLDVEFQPDDLSLTILSAVFLVLGFANMLWYLLEIITMLFNPKRRALHDFIAKTVVVRT